MVSAEHGGNRVPEGWRSHFEGHEATLASHRGWDPGTADLARGVASALGVQPVVAEVTRLLVDLNRSPHHPLVFSEITRPLPRAERQLLLDRFHAPHRETVTRAVERGIARGDLTIHLGVHSFTPVLDGVTRAVDVALLYDPQRPRERDLAGVWIARLRRRLPGFRVRRNVPYRGRSDGLTTTLRSRTAPGCYLGFEIEVNQALLEASGRFDPGLAEVLAGTLRDALRGEGYPGDS